MEKNGECFHFYGLSGMHNPFLLTGMGEALERIVKAVNNGEKIVIYGYHDIDGVTAVSVLLLVLKYLNADVEYFISEQTEGEFSSDSRNTKGQFNFLGANLIITVGCGTNSISQIEDCRNHGIDIIVTDYHDLQENTNETTIINPKRENCQYPFKNLTAVGIAFKLSQAISVYYRMKCISKYMDLVMIGTISKKSAFIDENKFIVEHGIYHLNYTNNYGLKAVLKVNKVEKIDYNAVEGIIKSTLSSVNNARGVDNARIMVELFTTSNSDRAEQIAKYLKKEKKPKLENILEGV